MLPSKRPFKVLHMSFVGSPIMHCGELCEIKSTMADEERYIYFILHLLGLHLQVCYLFSCLSEFAKSFVPSLKMCSK